MFESGCFYHVYNRGNDSQFIFFNEQNYYFFLNKIKAYITPHCDVIAYCLMPNHYHILLRVPEDRIIIEGKMDPLKRKLGTLQSSYTRAINKWKDKTGSLFQQKLKSKKLDSEAYQLTCFHYIHQNPLKARMVKDLSYWPYSSYLEYAGLRNGNLPSIQMAQKYLLIPSEPNEFVEESKRVIRDSVLPQIL